MMVSSSFAIIALVAFVSVGHAQVVGFNATAQYVDVSDSGPHPFVPPGPGDVRGPCPGLNALANHGFIPHNGISTATAVVAASEQVFGMAPDLGNLLSQYAALLSGDGFSYSIGAVRLLGQCVGGLSCSHNRFETDVSPTRCDLYQCSDHDVDSLRLPLWNELTGAIPTSDLSSLTNFRASRFNESISNNPNFFNGPISGLLVQPATYIFIYRLMANKSADFPEGSLNEVVLASFYSISGGAGNYTYTPGNERIPSNWYTRATNDQFTIPFFLSDVANAASEYPEFLDVGGNTGTTNSFVGVSISNLTGGVYNIGNLFTGNNLICFAFQSVQTILPSIVTFLLGLGIICPSISFNTTLLQQFPGFTM